MLDIITYPNPILRKKNKLVADPTSPEIKQLISNMLETLRSQDGLGLAAPQVGENLRLCIVEVDNEVFVLINPEIKKLYGDSVTMEEGCFSFPGKFLPVVRPRNIKLTAVDEAGRKYTMHAKGILARAIQHEIDHLDGILLVDRVGKKALPTE
ncbi:MAG TPA: peptide deformylase [Candidatus Moranbacteria bacterium]|nr:peptide deformylase [Candidatus Moranbacteria bacterium]